jgi:hypothetical protein
LEVTDLCSPSPPSAEMELDVDVEGRAEASTECQAPGDDDKMEFDNDVTSSTAKDAVASIATEPSLEERINLLIKHHGEFDTLFTQCYELNAHVRRSALARCEERPLSDTVAREAGVYAMKWTEFLEDLIERMRGTFEEALNMG